MSHRSDAEEQRVARRGPHGSDGEEGDNKPPPAKSLPIHQRDSNQSQAERDTLNDPDEPGNGIILYSHERREEKPYRGDREQKCPNKTPFRS
jgi:hypothetical protein